MNVVFATATARVSVGDDGGGAGVVQKGTHWPANDPVVLAHPEMFSDDARYGLQYSIEPHGYRDNMPGTERVEQATSAPGDRRQVRRVG